MNRQTGFSLIELMVALVLGLILTAGVISVYITSKNTYNVNNALGAVQEHGRFAFGFMDPKLRMAGYMGCYYVPKGASNNLTGGLATDPVFAFNGPVYGFEYTGTGVGGSFTPSTSDLTTPPQNASLWSPALNVGGSTTLYNAIKSTALKGSDIFIAEEMQNNPPALVGVYDDNTNLYVNTSDHGVNDTSYFANGTYAIVSNCGGFGGSSPQINIFKVTGVNAGSGTIAYNALSSHYATTGANGNVGTYQAYAYYIGKGVDGGPALFQASLSTAGALATQELVSGIENMQVVYGIATATGSTAGANAVPYDFQTADTVTDWSLVVSVRIALVARSDDNSTDQVRTAAPVYYMLASDPVANANSDGMTLTLSKDRRLRRYFVQTFTVRNGLP